MTKTLIRGRHSPDYVIEYINRVNPGFFVAVSWVVGIKRPSEFFHGLAIGFALMLILEGIIPFLYPQRWRNLVQQLSQINDRALRLIGFVSMMLGVVLLYIVN